MAGITGRNDLDDPIRGSGTATVCKFVLVTDNTMSGSTMVFWSSLSLTANGAG